MDLIGTRLNSGQRIDDTQTAVLVPVPVETNIAALLVDDAFYKSHDRARRRVWNGPRCRKRKLLAPQRIAV